MEKILPEKPYSHCVSRGQIPQLQPECCTVPHTQQLKNVQLTLRLEWKNNLKSYRKENINVVSIRGLAILFIWIHINKDWFDLTFLLQILQNSTQQDLILRPGMVPGDPPQILIKQPNKSVQQIHVNTAKLKTHPLAPATQLQSSTQTLHLQQQSNQSRGT